MANKEALAIVLDVGPGMCQGSDAEATFFEHSRSAIDMILQRKMFAESKDEISLILFGTADTANDLSAGDEAYANISIARPLAPVDWDLLQYVERDLKPGNMSADFLDAVVVAMDHLYKSVQGKKGFTSKRIVLFSNVSHEFGDDQLNDIIGSLKEAEIEFDVIGPDLDQDDDAENQDESCVNGSSGDVKPKTLQQKRGEALLRHMLNSECVEGSSYSFREALHALSHFQSRQIRSTAWKCNLEIGSGLTIPICLYTRIKEAKAKSFKNVYAKDVDADLERLRTAHLNDDEETEVEKSDLVDGHRYGRTLVPFSADDKEALKYKTEKCFKMLGFTKAENVKRHQVVGDSTWVCIADKTDESAVVALSALINAMYETNMVIIVRRVYAANGAIRLGCLTPNIKKNYECLFYTELPFAEDLRQFTFGSLPVEEADAGSQPLNRKFTPTDDQLSAVDELIDAMDLSTADRDVDGEETEAIKPKLMFNPHLQRLYQCLQRRALHPSDQLPDLSPVVEASLQVPSSVATDAQPVLEQLKKQFKLEPVAKKESATGETVFSADDGQNDEPHAKQAKLDDSADLAGGLPSMLKTKITEVGSTSPVEDFQALVADAAVTFGEAHSMMQKRLTDLVLDSFGSQSYKKAMECLQVLRSESIKQGDARLFNEFLPELKSTLVNKGRSNFWQEIVEAKLTLIAKSECSADDTNAATDDEAEKFLEADVDEEKKMETDAAEDADNLLEELE